MKEKKILKITAGLLLCTMLAYNVPVIAYTKDETIYQKLDASRK
jgi:hypothetical protein